VLQFSSESKRGWQFSPVMMRRKKRKGLGCLVGGATGRLSGLIKKMAVFGREEEGMSWI